MAIEWGSQADMEARRVAQRETGITLLRRPTADEALNSLLAGQAKAAIVDGVSGIKATADGLQIVTYLTDEWYAAAVHIQSRELLDAVNQTLTRCKNPAKWTKSRRNG